MAIISLLYRTAGAWGGGIGRNLTASEIDSNFYNLAQAIDDIELKDPRQITGISVVGNNVVIAMSSAPNYTFPLPVANIKFRGNWAGSTAYAKGDMFAINDMLYFVNTGFTSSGTFDPNQGPPGNPYAVAVIPYTTRIKVAWFWPTQPGSGLGSAATMFAYQPDAPCYATAGLVGAKAKLEVAATAAITYTLSKNATPIGSVNFEAGATVGTFSFNDTVTFTNTANDVLRCSSQTGTRDPTAAGLTLNIPLRLGTP